MPPGMREAPDSASDGTSHASARDAVRAPRSVQANSGAPTVNAISHAVHADACSRLPPPSHCASDQLNTSSTPTPKARAMRNASSSDGA